MTSSDFTYLPVAVKMEPQSPSVGRVNNRKRNFSQSSWSSSSSVTSTVKNNSKKVKKYELDPSVDPTVKNALAAKLNREKKKREEMELKEQNIRLKEDKELLEKQLEESVKRQQELARMLEEERQKNSGVNSGPYPQQTVDSFFQTVMTDVGKMADIPVENNIGFEDIDTSNWDNYSISDIELFPNLIVPDKLEKPEITPIDDCPSLWGGNDPLLQCQHNPSGNADLCDPLNERMQSSPNLWDVIKTMSMASTPMDY